MTSNPVLVSAGVLIEEGRVLLTLRKEGTHLAGHWEFPGGKVEPGEDPRDALVRELEEELGILVDVGEPLEVTFHSYADRPGRRDVLLLFFVVRRRDGSPEPQALDVAAFDWFRAEQLDDVEMPPADVAVVRSVRARLASASS